jgi:hypothetical protein
MIKFYPAKLKALDNQINRAFKSTAQGYSDQIDKELRSPKWDWSDRITKRRSGQVVGSPRDAVDLGTMVKSRQPVVIEGNKAVIEWSSDHASVVFTGLVDAQDVYPGRPANETAIAELPLGEYWRSQLRKQIR